MAGAGEGGEEEKQLAGGIQECPRNLLQQFSGGAICLEEAPAAASGGTEEDSGEIELSLGLSLGGCFGVNPASKRGLQRSSSIAAIPFLQPREEDPTVSPPLKRTASLPAEAEEEQRKRKELHCLRRMEAKRRKSEKANVSLPWARDLTASPEQDGDGEPGWLRRPENNQLGGWWAPNRVAAAVSRGGEAAAVEWTRGLAAASQGSVGSQGSSSSGVSDIGCRPQKKEELPSNGTGRWGSTSTTQQLTDLTEHKALTVGKPAKNGTAGREEEVEAPWKEPKAAGGMSRRNRGVNGAMEDMPCVSTRGGGPDGKLVEGFLYKYGKGEEVRIVCVCHGRFLSPPEFVRHVGGGDVAHPLRHIIVNPSPPFFL